MPARRTQDRISSLNYFVVAAVAFVAAAFVNQLWIAAPIVAADVFVLAGVARLVGLRFDNTASPNAATRLGTIIVLLFGYTVFVGLAIAYPMSRLLRDPTLGATMALSTTAVLVLLSLWKSWPALGLAILFRNRRESNAPLMSQVFARARRITGENELFFSHGLLVSLCLLLLVEGAFALGGFSIPLHGNQRLTILILYAVCIAPLASWVVVNRTASAVLIERTRERRSHAQINAPQTIAQDVSESVAIELSAASTATELDAMLLRCVRAGQTQLALATLDRGANPNCVPEPNDRDQRSVVELASVSPDMRLLRGLISKGADLNRAHAGLPPLIAATRDSLEGRPDAVMTLLTNGADPRCADSRGDTPLHCAALCEKPITAALLCDAGAPLDAVNCEGLTPLGIACSAANWEMVRFLLERSAKTETEHGQPAIMAAAAVDDDDIQGIKLLLKRKARVDARGPLKRTALMAAAMNGNELVAQMLIDAGANLGLADAHGTTALMEAARANAAEVLDVFATKNPPIDAVDNTGRTALIIACQSAHANEDIVRRLLGMGASREMAVGDGRRAVDFAATAGRWNIVALLDANYPRPQNLAAGTATASNDESAEHLLDALRFGHWNIVDGLELRVRDWPASKLAALFMDLISHDDPAPRRWLLTHGLAADTRIDDLPLLAHVLDQLPMSLPAACDLLDAAAPVGGNFLHAVCAALPNSAQHAALETFGLNLIERGADIFGPDRSGTTPLARIVSAGNVALTRVLIARGADPNARDHHGCTPLFAALTLPTDIAIDMIKLLIAAGANPDVVASSGETPLGLALSRSESSVQHWLNWHVWKLPQRPLRDDDVLAAASVGDASAIKKLVSLGFSPNAVDVQGATPLLRAAGNGHADAIACLLELGADSARTANSGATALSAAVIARNIGVVRALTAARRGDIDQRLKGGGTALMIAAALGFPDIAAVLLNAGADVDAADSSQTRALHAAAHFAFHGRDAGRAQQLLQTLLDHGATIDARNSEGQTPLLLLLGAHAEAGSTADQKTLLSLLPLLLQRHADINVADNRGVTSLHACAMHGLLLLARALVAAGADTQLRDMCERTPREVAHILGFIDVATELAATRAPAPISSSPRKAVREME
ncbi:MAG TPA: ankyrin repeat domain-containing protein [Rudaea sp.]|jgi:hypothetical protein|nr:ankyrin repeat domain-containing protein [Rudaea sp.]